MAKKKREVKEHEVLIPKEDYIFIAPFRKLYFTPERFDFTSRDELVKIDFKTVKVYG